MRALRLSFVSMCLVLALPMLAQAKTVPTLDPTKPSDLVTGRYVAILKTSKGVIRLRLSADIAPLAVTNFITLAKAGFYNGLAFHRVIDGFMIQGGDPAGDGTGGTSVFGPTFKDELSTSMEYSAGTLAMANRGPDTNGSQFFIMQKDYPLPPTYTIFGHVFGGMNVVNAIAKAPRDGNDRPLDPITFRVSIRRVGK